MGKNFVDGSPELIRLSIKDNGVGLNQTQQNMLFQPFVQADASTNRQHGGTGLGLSICSRLCDLMKGKIGCDSQAGKGAEFFVELPYRPVEKQDTSIESVDLSGLSVVIIGSDDEAQRFLELALDYQGVKCVNGRQDIKQLITLSDAVIIWSSCWEEYTRQYPESVITILEQNKLPAIVLQHDVEFEHSKISSNCLLVGSNPFLPGQIYQTLALAAGRVKQELEFSSSPISNLNQLPNIQQVEEMGLLILIVEDNHYNQEVLEKQLNLFGYVALIANNGKEALLLMEQHQFGLIITDCNMPVMDGYEFAREVRKLEQGSKQKLPIIAATANAMLGDKNACLQVGMNDWIVKPIELAQIKKILTKWLPIQELNSINLNRNKIALEENKQTKNPIEHSILVQYLGDDIDIQNQFLKAYVKQTEPMIAELKSKYETHNLDSVTAIAHKLKSSSRSIGAVLLADFCEELEENAKAKKLNEIIRTAAKVENEFKNVCDFIEPKKLGIHFIDIKTKSN